MGIWELDMLAWCTAVALQCAACLPGIAGVGAEDHEQRKRKGCYRERLVYGSHHIAGRPIWRSVSGLCKVRPSIVSKPDCFATSSSLLFR